MYGMLSISKCATGTDMIVSPYIRNLAIRDPYFFSWSRGGPPCAGGPCAMARLAPWLIRSWQCGSHLWENQFCSAVFDFHIWDRIKKSTAAVYFWLVSECATLHNIANNYSLSPASTPFLDMLIQRSHACCQWKSQSCTLASAQKRKLCIFLWQAALRCKNNLFFQLSSQIIVK